MIFQLRIKQWLFSFKKYFFTYRDGYFQLPYLSNSPELMVESFKEMPFTKYDPIINCIHTDNVFTDGTMYYRELEVGLWIIITEIEFKRKICTKALYDNEPCDYYFISYWSYCRGKEANINSINLPLEGWSLYKPGSEITSYFNKDDKGIFLNIAFSRTWFERNIKLEKMDDQHTLKQYLASDNAFIFWKSIVKGSTGIAYTILDNLKDKHQDSIKHFSLKMTCLDLMVKFLQGIASLHLSIEPTGLNKADLQQIVLAEKILTDALTSNFPRVEALAKAVHLSPTKLKVGFKLVYASTLFKYYQEKQMGIALEILTKGEVSVKEVAYLLGYNQVSNFTVAFKKYHNFLPSDIFKQEN